MLLRLHVSSKRNSLVSSEVLQPTGWDMTSHRLADWSAYQDLGAISVCCLRRESILEKLSREVNVAAFRIN